jgi:hypothetical protein
MLTREAVSIGLNMLIAMILQELNESMHSHLRLHFSNEEASDEQVSDHCMPFPPTCCPLYTMFVWSAPFMFHYVLSQYYYAKPPLADRM